MSSNSPCHSATNLIAVSILSQPHRLQGHCAVVFCGVEAVTIYFFYFLNIILPCHDYTVWKKINRQFIPCINGHLGQNHLVNFPLLLKENLNPNHNTT